MPQKQNDSMIGKLIKCMSFDDQENIWTMFVSNQLKDGSFRCLNVANDRVIYLDLVQMMKLHKIYVVKSAESQTCIHKAFIS